MKVAAKIFLSLLVALGGVSVEAQVPPLQPNPPGRLGAPVSRPAAAPAPITNSVPPLTGPVVPPLTGPIVPPLTGPAVQPLTGPAAPPLTGPPARPLNNGFATPLTNGSRLGPPIPHP